MSGEPSEPPVSGEPSESPVSVSLVSLLCL